MPTTPEKLDLRSMDVAADKRRLLRQLFPEVFTESTDAAGNPAEIDFEKLKAVLGEHATLADPAAERYGLDWPGKRDALKAVQTPALGTLVPCPEESVDWDSTKNVFIEGDNLEVLKLLQKSYYSKVKMIYIDPPYNTGNDFVYPDNYTESLETYLRYTGQISGEGVKLTTNSKDSGRFHSNWLRMMYPRLYVAKNLLKEDGVILISIDDSEVRNLRQICDQIFGEENFLAQFVWKARQFTDARAITNISTDHEYVVAYAKSPSVVFRGNPRDESKYANPDQDPRGDWMSRSILGLATQSQRPNLHYSIVDPSSGIIFEPPANTGWRYSKERMQNLINDGRILFPSKVTGRPREKKFRSDISNDYTSFSTVISDIFTSNGTSAVRDLFGGQYFDFPKPPELISRYVEQLTNDGDLVVDLFAGSASTAEGVFRFNYSNNGQRNFICVQLPEPINPSSDAGQKGYSAISDLAKERIRRAGAKIRAEFEAKAKQQEGELALDTSSTIHDPQSTISLPDLGFRVFKLAPSNFKRWDGGAAAESEEALVQQLEANLDHLAAEATEESILFEILLKAGFELTCPVETLELAGLNVFSIEQGALLLCLADRITPALIDAVAARQPVQFICLDRALHGDDALKVNALETFRACQPEIQFRTV